MEDRDTYKTKNLNLAAYLYASGLQLVNSTRIHGDVFFEFAPNKHAEKLVDNYFSDTASVNPRELFARLNALKDLIFQRGEA